MLGAPAFPTESLREWRGPRFCYFDHEPTLCDSEWTQYEPGFTQFHFNSDYKFDLYGESDWELVLSRLDVIMNLLHLIWNRLILMLDQLKLIMRITNSICVFKFGPVEFDPDATQIYVEATEDTVLR